MSSQPVSLLNAHSNTNGQRCCRSETFNLKDIEMIVEKKDQPWSKRACVGKLLGLTDIIKSTASLGQDDQQTRASSEAKQPGIWIGLNLKIDKIKQIGLYFFCEAKDLFYNQDNLKQ